MDSSFEYCMKILRLQNDFDETHLYTFDEDDYYIYLIDALDLNEDECYLMVPFDRNSAYGCYSVMAKELTAYAFRNWSFDNLELSDFIVDSSVPFTLV